MIGEMIEEMIEEMIKKMKEERIEETSVSRENTSPRDPDQVAASLQVMVIIIPLDRRHLSVAGLDLNQPIDAAMSAKTQKKTERRSELTTAAHPLPPNELDT